MAATAPEAVAALVRMLEAATFSAHERYPHKGAWQECINYPCQETRNTIAAFRQQPQRGEDVAEALEESVKLQSHYALLLNMHDGRERLTFASAEEWMARLRKRSQPKGSQP